MPAPLRTLSTTAAALAVAALAAGCAHRPRPAAFVARGPAPPPARAVDAERFYGGTWRVVARSATRAARRCYTPEWRFFHRLDGTLELRETCRVRSAEGRERWDTERARIVDKAAATQFHLRPDGAPFADGRDWRVLDGGEEAGGWAIVAPVDFRAVVVLARGVPPAGATARWAARTRALGYAGPLVYPVLQSP